MTNYDHLCINCRWFSICPTQINGPICKTWAPRTNKVKPRRLCDFCERHRPIEDDYGRYLMEFTELAACPSVNLTTGERTEPKNKFSYSLFVYEDKDDGEVGSFLIKYCPLCGRKLEGDGEK